MSLPSRPKGAPNVAVASVQGYESNEKPVANYPNPELETLQKTDARLKRQVRIFRFISRLLSIIASAFVVSTLAYSLARYYTTRTYITASGVYIWPSSTVLWPTFMLLAVGVITFLLNCSIVLAYCCGIKSANKVSTVSSYFGIAALLAHLVAWAVSTGLFKMANTGNDLWGWSCGGADAIEEEVKSFINFGQLCTIQTGSFGMMIVETVFYVIILLTYFVIARRVIHQRKMEKLLERGQMA